jgi:hypothetical protein
MLPLILLRLRRLKMCSQKTKSESRGRAPDECRANRQVRAGPLLEDLRSGLLRTTADLHNNATERALRSIALARKKSRWLRSI